MKKVISPIICAILLVLVFRLINPRMEAAGMLLLLILGLGIGAMVNKVIFRKKNAESEEDR